MPVHDWTRVPPNIFHDFHTAWIVALSHSLNDGLLPSPYYALIEQWSPPDIVADLAPLGGQVSQSSTDWRQSNSNVVSVADRPPQVSKVAECDLFPKRQRHISIRHEDGEPIAIIEIVSPDIKASQHWMSRFTERAAAMLSQELHLLVIDIFPPGPNNPQGIHGAIIKIMSGVSWTQPSEKPLTAASYESAGGVRAYFEPFAVGDALPPMPLFLAPGWYMETPLESSYAVAWDGTARPWREMITT